MDEMTLKVTGMSCEHCRTAVEKALRQVKGVSWATVDLASGEARVTGEANREELCAAIEDAGFEMGEDV